MKGNVVQNVERTSGVPNIGNLVHVGKQLFVCQFGQDVIQNFITANRFGCPHVSLVPAAIRIGFGPYSPISPRLARIPKDIIGMDEFVVLIVEIWRDNQDILKVSVALLQHEAFEATEIFFGISHGSMLNQQRHGVFATGGQSTAGMVGKGDISKDTHPISEHAIAG